MSRILIVSAFPPCSITAGQYYTKRLILDLIRHGHKVDIIYADYPGHTAELPDNVTVVAAIKPSLLNCLRLPYLHPFFTRRFHRKILNTIKRISPDYDLLYFDFSQVHLYSLFVDHPRKILMCHDIIYQKFLRKHNMIGLVNCDWIKKTEGKTVHSAKEIFTFSEKDSALLQKNYAMPSTPVNFYLKNEQFQYAGKQISSDFCLYGAWNRDENVEALLFFVDKVFPLVKRNICFRIIGGGLSESVQQKLSAFPRFRYLGFVDDPVSSLSECQALIAPLHQGAGVKVKVVDSLTAGTPVIGTEVAFEGLKDNEDVKLFYRADNELEFSNIINNWQEIDSGQKQKAADEFHTRYNKNHFPDYV